MSRNTSPAPSKPSSCDSLAWRELNNNIVENALLEEEWSTPDKKLRNPTNQLAGNLVRDDNTCKRIATEEQKGCPSASLAAKKIIIHDVQIHHARPNSPEYDIANMGIIFLDHMPQKPDTLPLQDIQNVEDTSLLPVENVQYEIEDKGEVENSDIEEIEQHEHEDNQTNGENQEQEDEQENKLSRKRKRQPEKWKRNVRKRKRQSGEEYLNTKGNPVEKKEVRQTTCSSEKCPFACGKKIPYAERSHIHQAFWRLTDEQKSHFISKHVTRLLAKRKRTLKEESRKKHSFEYYFEVNGVRLRVCQQFFLSTLDISKQKIYYFFNKIQEKITNVPRNSLRGKHTKKVIPEESLAEVRKHIESFPAVDSHYCRATSKKKYLERDLNLRRMYNLYIETTESPVNFKKYSDIFNYEYNISFFKPKKDLCDRCQEFEVIKEPSEKNRRDYEEHIRRKKLAKAQRDRDRALAKLEKKKLCVLCYDLENVFTLPKANVSHYYYRSKLNTFNLTGHCSTNDTVYNAIWHEYICGRGANHLAAALIKILKRVVRDNPELERLILWSDSCVPQNRNSILTFAIQSFLNSEDSGELKIIEHKYSEPGHSSVQEIDSVHSTIEAYVRDLEIWTPISLIRILSNMPTHFKMTFQVLQMQSRDYLDYQKSASKLSYNLIPYLQVKKLTYDKTLNKVYALKYATTFEGPETTQVFLPKKRNSSKENCRSSIFETAPHLLETNIGITEEKKEALKAMLPQMPDHAKEFYTIMINTNKVKPSKKRKTKDTDDNTANEGIINSTKNDISNTREGSNQPRPKIKRNSKKKNLDQIEEIPTRKTRSMLANANKTPNRAITAVSKAKKPKAGSSAKKSKKSSK